MGQSVYGESRSHQNRSGGYEANVTKMKVIGIGGAGCNAINRMIDEGVSHVNFIAVNTDMQALANSMASTTLTIGMRSTKGLGAGAKPEVGAKAATEDIEQIREVLQGTDMVFLTAGMGGGTGTGAAPIFAQVAKEIGALTVAVVTLPFDFEGRRRYEIAMEGIAKLKEHVDTLLVINNSRVFKVIERRANIKDAFMKIDEVLKQAVLGISSIISETGVINVDFADVRTVLSNKGEAIMGIGMGHGENRAIDAAKMALENPLIENSSFKNAGAILINIIGGADFTMHEFDEAARAIVEYCRDDAEIITGLSVDDNLKDKVKIIIVATDFQNDDHRRRFEEIPAEDIFVRTNIVSLDKVAQRDHSRYASMRRTSGYEEDREAAAVGDDLDVPAFIRKRKKSI